MATFCYDAMRQRWATTGQNLLTSTIKAMLVSAAYSPQPAHVFVSDVSGIIVRSAEVTGKSVVKGIFACEIPELEALLSGSAAVGLILYVDTGNDATSRLVYYSSDGVGFPFLPQGINYFIGYDQANGGFLQV